ncbi:VOC family protein [Flavobacterium faecale]|uniref:VOC family protein n=1 Tax=Flavobacterium faecale TaxID=1355330 RepID=UPI003AAA65D9
MKKQVFINLPIADLKKAMDFYTAVGFINNPQFTDETAACMVVSNEIYVMLLTHDKFQQFTNKQIADTKKTASVINALSMQNNDEVNQFMEKAIAAGGNEPYESKDYGFMLQRCIEDLDGNIWEVFYMDITKFPKQ